MVTVNRFGNHPTTTPVAGVFRKENGKQGAAFFMSNVLQNAIYCNNTSLR